MVLPPSRGGLRSSSRQTRFCSARASCSRERSGARGCCAQMLPSCPARGSPAAPLPHAASSQQTPLRTPPHPLRRARRWRLPAACKLLRASSPRGIRSISWHPGALRRGRSQGGTILDGGKQTGEIHPCLLTASRGNGHRNRKTKRDLAIASCQRPPAGSGMRHARSPCAVTSDV